MVDVQYDNSEFDAILDTPLPHVQWLVEQRRLFETQADLTTEEAKKHLRRPQPDPGGRYGGFLVSPRPGDFVAARQIARRRGYGEEVTYLVTQYHRTEEGEEQVRGVVPPWPLDQIRKN